MTDASYAAGQVRLWSDVLRLLGGASAVFVDASGHTTSLSVMLAESMQMQPVGGQVQTWIQGKVVSYSLTDIPREVVVGESFVIGSVTYKVQFIISNDGYVVKAAVS